MFKTAMNSGLSIQACTSSHGAVTQCHSPLNSSVVNFDGCNVFCTFNILLKSSPSKKKSLGTRVSPGRTVGQVISLTSGGRFCHFQKLLLDGWQDRYFGHSLQSAPKKIGRVDTSQSWQSRRVAAIAGQSGEAIFFDQEERVGVLLLNLGGPETLDDVEPFLYNLFADPDIIRLPRLFRFLQSPLARFVSTLRAPKSAEGYAAIGGGSPLRKITDEQAVALRKALESKNLPAKVYVGMRYWHPFTEEALEQVKKDGITRLVILPLYPQFSISTSGSSLRLLESIFRKDEYLSNMEHTVIPSWYHRGGYVQSMATLIEKELSKFSRPEEVHIFFSAHGVPLSYVKEAGDPYKAEMEECVELIMNELKSRAVNCKHTLAYQSRVGPVEWLKPYTDAKIKELGKQGVTSLLAVPVSFVSEHIETLEEIDMEYRELALESGIVNWGRVPALNCEPAFIADLADAVLEALPHAGAMSVPNVDPRPAVVPLGSVEELLITYDVMRRRLPPPVAMWEWGWTKSAETWNGRIAMLAVLGLLLLEVTSGEGILHKLGMFHY